MPLKGKLDNTHVCLMLQCHGSVFATHFCTTETRAKKLGPFAEDVKVIIQELLILKRVKNICTHCPMNFIHKEMLFSCTCTLQLNHSAGTVLSHQIVFNIFIDIFILFYFLKRERIYFGLCLENAVLVMGKQG